MCRCPSEFFWGERQMCFSTIVNWVITKFFISPRESGILREKTSSGTKCRAATRLTFIADEKLIRTLKPKSKFIVKFSLRQDLNSPVTRVALEAGAAARFRCHRQLCLADKIFQIVSLALCTFYIRRHFYAL